MFRDHKMVIELIETSRKATIVQMDSHQATSRLETVPNPRASGKPLAPKPLAAWSQVGVICFASSSSLNIFLHLFSLSSKTVHHSSIFTSDFFLFHPFLCPNQSFKLKPMYLIFINHFSIIISSLVLHSFLVLSHA